MIDSTCELQLELATAIQPVLWFAAHSIVTRDLAHTHVQELRRQAQDLYTFLLRHELTVPSPQVLGRGKVSPRPPWHRPPNTSQAVQTRLVIVQTRMLRAQSRMPVVQAQAHRRHYPRVRSTRQCHTEIPRRTYLVYTSALWAVDTAKGDRVGSTRHSSQCCRPATWRMAAWEPLQATIARGQPRHRWRRGRSDTPELPCEPPVAQSQPVSTL